MREVTGQAEYITTNPAQRALNRPLNSLVVFPRLPRGTIAATDRSRQFQKYHAVEFQLS